MFTLSQLHTLIDAIDLALSSNKRAMNTRKNPEFMAIYEKIGQELAQVRTIVDTERKIISSSTPPQPNKQK